MIFNFFYSIGLLASVRALCVFLVSGEDGDSRSEQWPHTVGWYIRCLEWKRQSEVYRPHKGNTLLACETNLDTQQMHWVVLYSYLWARVGSGTVRSWFICWFLHYVHHLLVHNAYWRTKATACINTLLFFVIFRQHYQSLANQSFPSYASMKNLFGCTIDLKRMRTMLVLLWVSWTCADLFLV